MNISSIRYQPVHRQSDGRRALSRTHSGLQTKNCLATVRKCMWRLFIERTDAALRGVSAGLQDFSPGSLAANPLHQSLGTIEHRDQAPHSCWSRTTNGRLCATWQDADALARCFLCLIACEKATRLTAQTLAKRGPIDGAVDPVAIACLFRVMDRQRRFFNTPRKCLGWKTPAEVF